MIIRSANLISSCVLLIFLLSNSLATPASVQQQGEGGETSRKVGSNDAVMKKVFNFEKFKSIFKKTYANILEDSAREKIFLGRAFRAFISFINYKHYKSNYYLKISDMSDWTQAEFQSILSEESYSESLQADEAIASSPHDYLLETPVADLEAIERMIDSSGVVSEEEDFLFDLSRNKRETEEEEEEGLQPLKRESLTLDDIFPNSFEEEEDEGEGNELDTSHIKSNNPSYVPPELQNLEAQVGDDDDDSIDVMDENISKTILNLSTSGSFITDAWNYLFSSNKNNNRNDDIPKQSNENNSTTKVKNIDLRTTLNCFGKIKHQGSCGSCYIFSTMALYEWQYCIESGGQKISFSEQYPLDCGERVGMKGCAGGNEIRVGSFVGKYGLELSRNYQYRRQSDICPYDEDIHPKKTGYLRVKKSSGGIIVVDYDQILNFIKSKIPVAIGVGVSEDFSDYGGGVYDGSGCRGKGNWHAMVIIGHGLEDGQEYWLMRNSYGPRFGLKGHYKINSKALHCFANDGMGFIVYNRDNPENKIFNLEGNNQYNEAFVKQRYLDYQQGKPIAHNPYTYFDRKKKKNETIPVTPRPSRS